MVSISPTISLIIGALPRTDSFKICLPEQLSPIFERKEEEDNNGHGEDLDQLPVMWIKILIKQLPHRLSDEDDMIVIDEQEEEEEEENFDIEFDKYEKAYEELKMKKHLRLKNKTKANSSRLLLFRKCDLPLTVSDLVPGIEG